MASGSKLGGATTMRNLAKACERLGCTENEFRAAVTVAVKAGGDTPCLPDDEGCISKQALPYIRAVLDGDQKRLPLSHISTGTNTRARPPQPDRKKARRSSR